MRREDTGCSHWGMQWALRIPAFPIYAPLSGQRSYCWWRGTLNALTWQCPAPSWDSTRDTCHLNCPACLSESQPGPAPAHPCPALRPRPHPCPRPRPTPPQPCGPAPAPPCGPAPPLPRGPAPPCGHTPRMVGFCYQVPGLLPSRFPEQHRLKISNSENKQKDQRENTACHVTSEKAVFIFSILLFILSSN